MANIRRGAAADCPRAVTGAIAFRSGSARPTPAPRSIARREMEWVFKMVSLRSFVSEQIARNDLLNNVAGSVAGAAGSVENFLDLFAVREADRRARCVGGELADEVPGHRLLLAAEQELFELANVFETA